MATTTSLVYAYEVINGNNRRTVALFNNFNDAMAYAKEQKPNAGEWYKNGGTYFADINPNQTICIYPFPVK